MNDRVALDLAAGSPADRRGVDFAVLLHIALLCGPVPGPGDSDGAWRSLTPVTGPDASRSAIAQAVLGDGTGPAAQGVGQCLLRLRDHGDKKGRRYDPPLLAAVDRQGRRLPAETGAGRDGYHGYVPLPVFGPPAAPLRPAENDAPALDIADAGSGGVQRPPPRSSLDEDSGGVQRPPGKERRTERGADGAGSPSEPGPKTVPSSSSLRSEKDGTGNRERPRWDSTGTVADSARALGLPPFQMLKRAGDTEGAPPWRRDVSFNIANTALSVAAAVIGDPSLASGGSGRSRVFEPWRLAAQRLLDADPPVPWHDLTEALTLLLVEDGPGTTTERDDNPVHRRSDDVLRARDRLRAVDPYSDAARAAATAAGMVGLAVDHWREQHPPMPPIDAGQPDHPPF